MTTVALIVAAGRGSRAGTARPKQYVPVAGPPPLVRAISAFLAHQSVNLVQAVIADGDSALYEQVVPQLEPRLLAPVYGGPTRQASVHLGLRALGAHRPDKVLIHDAARPFVGQAVITRVLDALAQAPAAIAAIPVTDTIKQAGPDQHVTSTLDRSKLWRAQTPQGFRYADILAAHETAVAAGKQDLTDDAAVAELAGIPVVLVTGSEANRKLTTAEDMAMPIAPALSSGEVRTGNGFDVHRFTTGDHLWLCGIEIKHTHALAGHSDADVSLHAVTDALLGAIGEGDIGELFPDSDPQWKGAPSHLFVAEALRRLRARSGSIANVDVTIVCETPKVAPHRTAMRQRLAEILQIDLERVAVKATTSEGLGFTGRREGIAAFATATVLLRSGL